MGDTDVDYQQQYEDQPPDDYDEETERAWQEQIAAQNGGMEEGEYLSEEDLAAERAWQEQMAAQNPAMQMGYLPEGAVDDEEAERAWQAAMAAGGNQQYDDYGGGAEMEAEDAERAWQEALDAQQEALDLQDDEYYEELYRNTRINEGNRLSVEQEIQELNEQRWQLRAKLAEYEADVKNLQESSRALTVLRQQAITRDDDEEAETAPLRGILKTRLERVTTRLERRLTLRMASPLDFAQVQSGGSPKPKMRVKFALPEGHRDDDDEALDVGLTEEQILEQLIEKAGSGDVNEQEYLEMSLQFIEDYAAEEARLREESEEIRRMEEQLRRMEEELVSHEEQLAEESNVEEPMVEEPAAPAPAPVAASTAPAKAPVQPAAAKPAHAANAAAAASSVAQKASIFVISPTSEEAKKAAAATNKAPMTWKQRQEEQKRKEEEDKNKEETARKRKEELEKKRKEEEQRRKQREEANKSREAQEAEVKNKIQADYQARKQQFATNADQPNMTWSSVNIHPRAVPAGAKPAGSVAAATAAPSAKPKAAGGPVPSLAITPGTRPVPAGVSPRPLNTGPVRPATNISPSALRSGSSPFAAGAAPSAAPKAAGATTQQPAATPKPSGVTTGPAAPRPSVVAGGATQPNPTPKSATAQPTPSAKPRPAIGATPTNPGTAGTTAPGSSSPQAAGPGAAPVQTRLRRATPPVSNHSNAPNAPTFSVLPTRSTNGSVFIRNTSPFEDPVKRGVARPATSSPTITAKTSLFESAEAEEEEKRKAARRARLDHARGQILAKGKEDPTALLPKEGKPFLPGQSQTK